jgi:CelD/BcsL family acetyltransferase involved in cellulose biosynthesis
LNSLTAASESPMTALHVEVIRDRAALLAMGREWDALVERAGIDHPFLRHDWVYTWWECFGGGKELYVVAVRSGELLVGLAPLMRTRARMYGIPVRRLELMANDHTPRFDLVVAAGFDEVYGVILDHLRAQAPSWDVVMLPELSGTSQTVVALERLARAKSIRSGTWSGGSSPKISLAGGFDAFMATLSSTRRATLRKRLRRLQLLGPVAIEVVGDLAGLPEALQDGLRIESAAWKGAAGTAIASDEAVRRFYLQIAERAAQSKALKLVFLEVGGKRIAFAYCLRQGSTLYLLKTGYDPEYAEHSPFNVLMLLAVEAACRDGIETFDLLGSADPWKVAWTRLRTERLWLFLYRNTLAALVIYGIKVMALPRLKRVRSRLWPAVRAAASRGRADSAADR